jgi:hypothetical protein
MPTRPGAIFVFGIPFWVLYQSGPAFPLSLLILGIVPVYCKKVSWPAGILLSLSGISFPVGRILRNVALAHTTDFLLLAAIFWIFFQVMEKGKTAGRKSKIGGLSACLTDWTTWEKEMG